MTDIELKLWEFGKAPAHLQDLFPDKIAGDWLVLIHPDLAPSFVSDLVVLWSAAGLLVAQGQSPDGDVVLAGLRTELTETQ